MFKGQISEFDDEKLHQIYLVTFMCLRVDTSFVFTKKSNVAKLFFDIFNVEIAQCCQKLDVILGTKVKCILFRKIRTFFDIEIDVECSNFMIFDTTVPSQSYK